MNIRLAAVALLACANWASATTISYYDFNNSLLPLTTNQPGLNGSFSLSASGSYLPLYFPAGTSDNALTSVATADNYGLMIKGSSSNGRTLTFRFDSTGFKDIKFSFEVISLSQLGNFDGFGQDVLNYLPKGDSIFKPISTFTPPTSYTTTTPPTVTPAPAYQLMTFDLSETSDLNNNPNAAIQIVLGGAKGSGAIEFDNFQINGTAAPAAVPLPPAILGGAALLGVRAFKRRRQ